MTSIDKMQGESVNLHIKLDELRGQRLSLRRDVQELRATLEDRDWKISTTRSPLWRSAYPILVRNGTVYSCVTT